jgi:hypothetical protein
MVPDGEHPILETNCAAIRGAGGLGNILILAAVPARGGFTNPAIAP